MQDAGASWVRAVVNQPGQQRRAARTQRGLCVLLGLSEQGTRLTNPAAGEKRIHRFEKVDTHDGCLPRWWSFRSAQRILDKAAGRRYGTFAQYVRARAVTPLRDETAKLAIFDAVVAALVAGAGHCAVITTRPFPPLVFSAPPLEPGT
jgi:hypothetical protein